MHRVYIYMYTKTQFDFSVFILITVIIYSRLGYMLRGERMKESHGSYSCQTIDASLLFVHTNFPPICESVLSAILTLFAFSGFALRQ